MTLSRLSDRVGQVLSERYRLLAAIGSGASASVYLADDVTLRRRVAVKILHPALAGDEAFLRRFRAEAQAAAALNHPNVMAVYDWGHDEVPFLVTEYLGGGSLRTILDQGRLLAPAQTLVVGLEASRGLDYAHRQGFVHRDVKPANLLFDEEARLRIADFGLARALAEAAWTEPHGAVLGTARYASPEQARGEHLDGRSDVYSLALVMIEAVTGVVPFSGDTTIGTLMARVETPPEVPESLGALRAPLLAAGTVRPADRPDAGEFSRLLLLAAEHLDRPEPLALAGAMVHDHAVVADRDPTTIRHPEAEPDIMSAPPGTVIDGIRVIPDDPRAATAAGAAAATTIATPRAPAPPLARFVPEGDGDPPAPPRTKRSHKRLWIGLALVLALLAIGGGAYAYWYNSVRVATHPMPNLVGTNVSQLGHTIAGTDWKVHQGAPIAKDGTVPGQILLQKPLPGVQLAEGATIDLLVSSGPPPVPLPTDLAGKPLVAATAELQAEGLKLGAVSREFSETAARDVVLRVAPGVAPVLPKGSAVPLVVSAGPKPRTIPPGIVGGNVDAAKAQLSALGLVVVVNPQSDENIPAGTVMASNPASGASVPKGSTVTLTVSSGPPTVVIPADIANKSVTDAAAELQSLGLTVSGINGSPLAHVKGTNPAVGTTVRKGTAVQLITG